LIQISRALHWSHCKPFTWNLRAGSMLRASGKVEENMMETTPFTDAIALLKADHRKVETLFEQFEKTQSASRKQSLAHEICAELKIHTMIEEEIFYPAFRGKIEDDTLDEAYVEHDGAKVLINDIEASSPDDDFYDAKVKVLSEDIKHHVHEEEMPSEGMFAQCRKTDVDLVALRDQLLARKEELLAQAKAGGLPLAKPNAVHLIAA
jgi:hemerythrin superfamily protein